MKTIYFFGEGKADGHGRMKELLGGKGAGLAEMTNLGLPVPAGFTITTEACVHFYKAGGHVEGLDGAVTEAMARLEQVMGKRFGHPKNSLLVSVRSGARASMPGMMDTILNLGLNDEVVAGLAETSGDPRFAWDSYRRFIQMYGDVVLEVEKARFHHALEALKAARGFTLDTELSADDLRQLVGTFKAIVLDAKGKAFPTDPRTQLWGAIEAVFRSWNNDRAKEYRRMDNIPDEWGTAVNVQAMVFGNMGEDCATGVCFTRNPNTGEPVFFGEYLTNAQGEDVVAGIRTPLRINGDEPGTLEKRMPEVYAQLNGLRLKLEGHFKDMQDIEFTVEKGRLWMLQTRNGKRTADAALRIALDMVREGQIDHRTAVSRVTAQHIEQLMFPRFDPKVRVQALCSGLAAGSGAARGQIVFSAEEAVDWKAEGKDVILVREETSPEDIGGMRAARGIVTARGGASSHAAVVARQMGRSCVAGCQAISIDERAGTMRVGQTVLKRGDWISIEGNRGLVVVGQVPLVDPEFGEDFFSILRWADEVRRLGVRTNADTPEDSKNARFFGAEGIGLTRTEHMFFHEDRLPIVREMLISDTLEERRKALAKILPMQREDFRGIFREMKGLPVTIRLLDPPLHEFLPKEKDDIEALARTMGVAADVLTARVSSLHELNPMLGHRGCRLGITFPEIYEMQVEAIVAAACELVKDEGFSIVPEIMIPLVGLSKELEIMRKLTCETADRVIASYGVPLTYLVGTMIELPRACVAADRVADHADFFSFGTNDLTQTTFGISRDDGGKFLPAYQKMKIIDDDPFATIDTAVAELIKMAVTKGRKTRPKLKVGICGEHGGDPRSVEICHVLGLDYVSCAPFRVPVARMAAAHAALKS